MDRYFEMIAGNAATLPDSGALALRDRRIDWHEMAEMALAFSRALGRMGAGAGQGVALYAQCSIGLAVAVQGCTAGGQILIPLNTRLAAREIVDQLEDSQPTVVLVDDALLSATRDWPEAWRARIVRIGPMGDLPDGVALKPNAGCALGAGTTTLLYTGGTTGKSKGVAMTSGAMIANASAIVTGLGIGPDDVCLLNAPMFHISGLGLLWVSAISGAACVPHVEFTPESVCAALTTHGATTLFLAPVMMQILLDDPNFDPTSFATVRNILYGASPISDALLSRVLKTFPKVRLTQAYGQTEICPISLLRHEDHLAALDGRPRILRSAGRVVTGLEVRILDRDGAPVPTGTPGEIHASGPNRMSFYLGLPEQSAETLRDGWIKTGDIGYLDDEGFLFLVDRSKDMIVTGGENVFSIEVENALAAHPAVVRAAVIGVPDAKWGERVHAIVETCTAVSAEALIAFCRQSLAGYKCPKSLEFSDGIPLTAAGKIDKKILRAPFWADKSTRIG